MGYDFQIFIEYEGGMGHLHIVTYLILVKKISLPNLLLNGVVQWVRVLTMKL